jgi:uncharacterized membrane protein YgcG
LSMSASEGGASGGALRGQGVAVALVAIVAGMALVVAYAASDGAIFGLNANPSSSSPDNGQPASSGATVISRDAFDEENAPSQPEENDSGIPPPKPGATLSEEESKLLAMSDYPWDSIAGGYVASNHDSIGNLSEPSPVQTGTEQMTWTDKVIANVARDNMPRNEAQDDLGLADNIPADITENEEQQDDEVGEEERPPQDTDEQEEPRGGGSGSGNQTGGESSDDSGDGSGSEGSDGDDSSDGGGASVGNSTNVGNSTGTQDPSEDSSGSSNSTAFGVTISIG